MIKTSLDVEAPLNGPVLSSWEVVRGCMFGDMNQIYVRGNFQGIKITRTILMPILKQHNANCIEDIKAIQLAVENELQQMLIDVNASSIELREKREFLRDSAMVE
jgi:hypothetical protein